MQFSKPLHLNFPSENLSYLFYYSETWPYTYCAGVFAKDTSGHEQLLKKLHCHSHSPLTRGRKGKQRESQLVDTYICDDGNDDDDRTRVVNSDQRHCPLTWELAFHISSNHFLSQPVLTLFSLGGVERKVQRTPTELKRGCPINLPIELPVRLRHDDEQIPSKSIPISYLPTKNPPPFQ